MNDHLDIIEVQGTAEDGTFSRTQLNQIMDLAQKGIQELLAFQSQAIWGRTK